MSEKKTETFEEIIQAIKTRTAELRKMAAVGLLPPHGEGVEPLDQGPVATHYRADGLILQARYGGEAGGACVIKVDLRVMGVPTVTIPTTFRLVRHTPFSPVSDRKLAVVIVGLADELIEALGALDLGWSHIEVDAINRWLGRV